MQATFRCRRVFCFSFVVAGCLSLVGCGTDTIPVTGTVTYNGKPLQHGRVGFFPTDGRPAYGDIDERGQFTITSKRPGDGALAGTYKVVVHCDEPANPDDAFGDRYWLIPEKYTTLNDTPLTAEVSPERHTFEFELTGSPPPRR